MAQNATKAPNLRITIIDCVDLKRKSSIFKSPDFSVRVSIVRDGIEEWVQTTVSRDAIEPKWNEHFDFFASKYDILSISIYTKTGLHSGGCDCISNSLPPFGEEWDGSSKSGGSKWFCFSWYLLKSGTVKEYAGRVVFGVRKLSEVPDDNFHKLAPQKSNLDQRERHEQPLQNDRGEKNSSSSAESGWKTTHLSPTYDFRNQDANMRINGRFVGGPPAIIETREERNDNSPTLKQRNVQRTQNPAQNPLSERLDILETYKSNALFLENTTIEYISQEKHRTWHRARSLGNGTFSQVWQEKTEDDYGDVHYRAVKVCALERMRRSGIDYKRELSALARFSSSQHSGLFVNLHGWWMTDSSLYVAMDFHSQGALSNIIKQGIDELGAKEITSDLLQGLYVMHQEGFTHRDIKPQNILVVRKRPEARKWWVKIGDFGISKRVLEDSTTDLHTSVGTRPYCAPEILGYLFDRGEIASYSPKVDIWSLGCVVFNIASKGRLPFTDAELVRYCDGNMSLNLDNLPLTLSPSGRAFLGNLLQPQPTSRPTADEALRNVWYTSESIVAQVMNTPGSQSSPKTSSVQKRNEKKTVRSPRAYNSFLESTISNFNAAEK